MPVVVFVYLIVRFFSLVAWKQNVGQKHVSSSKQFYRFRPAIVPILS